MPEPDHRPPNADLMSRSIASRRSFVRDRPRGRPPEPARPRRCGASLGDNPRLPLMGSLAQGARAGWLPQALGWQSGTPTVPPIRIAETNVFNNVMTTRWRKALHRDRARTSHLPSAARGPARDRAGTVEVTE